MSQPLVPVSKRLYNAVLRLLGWYGLIFVPLLVMALVSGLVRDVIPPMLAIVLVLPGVIGSLVLIDAGGRLRHYIEPQSGRENLIAALVVAALLLPVAMQVAATAVVFDLGWLLALLDLGVTLEAMLSPTGLLDRGWPTTDGQPASAERLLATLMVLLCLAPLLIGGAMAVLLAAVLRFDGGGPAPVRAEAPRPAPEAAPPRRRPPSPEDHAAAKRAFRQRLATRKAG